MPRNADVRSSRGRFAAAAVVALSLVLAGCGGSDPEPDAGGSGSTSKALRTIKVGVVPTVNTAMPNLAIDQNLGAPHGLKLERTTISGAGSTNQVAALLSGDLDVAVGGTNTAIDAVAEGANIQVISGVAPLLFSMVLNKKVADGLGVAADAPITERIKALKGLKMAVSPPGSTGNSVLRTILVNAGMDPDRDVDFVPLTDVGAVPAGISRGTYDGSFVAVGAGEVNIANGTGVLWASLPRGDFEEFNDFLGVVSFATKDFVAKNPDVVKGVHDAFAAAQKMTVDEPDKAAKTLKDSIFKELDQSVFDVAWNQVKDAYPDGMYFTEASWNTFKELFDASSEKDYSKIAYEDLVAEPARGS